MMSFNDSLYPTRFTPIDMNSDLSSHDSWWLDFNFMDKGSWPPS